jgi:hypothetical protein
VFYKYPRQRVLQFIYFYCILLVSRLIRCVILLASSSSGDLYRAHKRDSIESLTTLVRGGLVMALCSGCSSKINYDKHFPRINPPDNDAEPYCSLCGKPNVTICFVCGGTGYMKRRSFPPELYCDRCGRTLGGKPSEKCFWCHGDGKMGHLCS